MGIQTDVSGMNAYARINLDSLVSNYRVIAGAAGRREVIAVVKANAYGHGAGECALALEAAGARRFAVANVDEAVSLRGAGVSSGILILGYVPECRLEEAAGIGAALTVYSPDFARKASLAARSLGTRVKVHVKFDTGMNRLGFKSAEGALEAALEAADLEGVEVEGVYSHFASSDDPDTSFSSLQYSRFLSFVENLRRRGLDPPLIHIDNSAGALRFAHEEMTAVRAGLALYGAGPYDGAREEAGLKPVMSFCARIASISTLDGGEGVGYSRTYRTSGRERIAVVSCGYADGYLRACSNRARVWTGSGFMKVTGNVCMDMFMADATGLDGLEAGDEVELFGEHVTVEELAGIAGTIPYELLCLVSGRVRRVYGQP